MAQDGVHSTKELQDSATGEEVVLAGSTKESVTEEPDGENDGEVAEDDGENRSHQGSKLTPRPSIVASQGER